MAEMVSTVKVGLDLAELKKEIAEADAMIAKFRARNSDVLEALVQHRVMTVRAEPGDTVVVTAPLGAALPVERLVAQLKAVLPEGVKVAVLCGGFAIGGVVGGRKGASLVGETA